MAILDPGRHVLFPSQIAPEALADGIRVACELVRRARKRDGALLVAIFGSEGLFCFDMEGNLVWNKDLGPMDSGYYAVPSEQWGFASSPVIQEGKVIVLCDVQTNSFLAAFDLATGKALWRTARADVPTWGTPTVAQAGQRTEILVNGWHHTAA